MIKARNKKISLLIAIVFVMTLVLPMGSAFAATTYNPVTTPKIDADSEDYTGALGKFEIEIDPLSSGTHEAWVELPDYVDVTGVSASATDENGPVAIASVDEVDDGDNGFMITLSPGGDLNDVSVIVNVYEVTVDEGSEAGAIIAKIENLNGQQLVDGDVTVGYVSSGAVTVSMQDDPTFSEDGGICEIRVKETIAGSLSDEDDLKIVLPDGFEWGTIGNIEEIYGAFVEMGDDEAIGGSGADADTVVTGTNAVKVTGTDDDELVITLQPNVSSTSAAAFDVFVNIEVADEDDAEYGDVVAKIKGDYDATPDEITVGKYGDFGATIAVDGDVPEVYAGYDDQAVVDLTIEESIKESLIVGRTVQLTLPSNARWMMIGDTAVENLDGTTDRVSNIDGKIWLAFSKISGTDNRTLTLKVAATSPRTYSDAAAELTIEDIEVALEAGVTGDLKIEVEGSAGLEGELTIAKVVAPITASADKNTVVIGKFGQPAGDITITETKGSALNTGNLVLLLPEDVEFDGTPTVEVTEGDLEIGDVDVKDDYNNSDKEALVIEIEDDSNDASTIVISGIEYAINRVLPEGDIEVEIGGPAAVETHEVWCDWDNDSSQDNNEDEDFFFEDSDAAAVLVNATCGTPAPANKTVSFKIGDPGVVAMNGRTLVQVNTLCDVLGLQKSWDAATNTAYFVKDGNVVAFPIGKNQIVINGSAIAVDQGGVAYNNFTYATLRGLEMAFGGELTWDQATQTATFEF